jgi:hypothetical protein
MKRPWLAPALWLIFAVSPATAQFADPTEGPPRPPAPVEGKAPRPTAATDGKPHTPKVSKTPAASATPAAAAVVGKPLLLNGATGELQLSGTEDALRIDRLTLLGEVISDPTQQCKIDVGGGGPIDVKSAGRPDGLLRYTAAIPICPFEFDVLEESVLVPPQIAACVFKEADCLASPSGLWGPAGGLLEKDAKLLERARLRAEAAVAANYRALNARLNDPTKAGALANEQSRFAADRQDICRNYAGESVHSFCATRLTEARAAFLKARFDEAAPATAAREKPAPKHRHKPTPSPAPPT